MLKDIRTHQVQQNATKDSIAQLNYAIDKISSRAIYEIEKPFLDTLDLHDSLQHAAVTKGWIHEFSSMGLDILRDISLMRSLEERKKSKDDTQSKSESPSLLSKSRPPSMNTVQKYLNDYDHLLTKIQSVDFNIH